MGVLRASYLHTSYGDPPKIQAFGPHLGVATTSLNFWAGVLHMQDIKTRFGLSRNEDGTFDKNVPQQTVETCATRYSAVNFSKANRKLGPKI